MKSNSTWLDEEDCIKVVYIMKMDLIQTRQLTQLRDLYEYNDVPMVMVELLQLINIINPFLIDVNPPTFNITNLEIFLHLVIDI